MDEQTEPKGMTVEEILESINVKRQLPNAKIRYLDYIINFCKNSPGKYDAKLITRMKLVGMHRPEWIPKEAWVKSRNAMGGSEELMIRMAAAGMTPVEIGKHLGIGAERTKQQLASDEFKKKIIAVQEKWFGGDPKKMIRSAVVEAISTEIQIMRDSAQKGSTRLNALQDIIDRGLGKAPQEVIVNDSNIRNVMERLDKIERSGGYTAIEVKAETVEDAENPDLGEDSIEPAHEAEPLDDVDKWLIESGLKNQRG